MKKSFYCLAFTALILGGCGCSPRSTPPKTPDVPPPQTSPAQETPQNDAPPSDASTQTTQNDAPPSDASTQTTQNDAPPSDASTQTPQNDAPPSANAQPRPTQAPALEALRRRQEKAERAVAKNDFADAVQNADYVASQIRVAELDRRGSNGDGQDAREYATLLESALKTLEQCSRQAERSSRAVPPSETTSVLL